MKNFQLYRGSGPSLTEAIDDYRELVWAERFLDMSDFLLVCPDTPENRSRFGIGTWLTHNQSPCVMRVFTLEEITSPNGDHELRVTGYGLESILRDRSVRPTGGLDFRRYTNYRASVVASAIIRGNLVDGTMFHEYDTMLNVAVANVASTVGELQTWALPIQSAWDAVHDVLASDNLGLTVSRTSSSQNINFTITAGNDRTESVIFSAPADWLIDDRFLDSDDGYKTVAYVYGKNTARYIYRFGTDNTTQGFFRRVLTLSVTDIESSDLTAAQKTAAIESRARTELAKHTRKRVIDGRLAAANPYVYRTDYTLGDIVTVMSRNGRKDSARITEYIWSINAEGVEAYPTFTSTSMEED